MFYNLLVVAIARVFGVAETASPKLGLGSLTPKPVNCGLKLLDALSNVIGDEGIFPESGGAEDNDEDRRHRGHHVLQPAGGWDREGVRRRGDHLPQAGQWGPEDTRG